LWAYTIRTEEQYKTWKCQDIKDVPFLCLMAMEVYNWEALDQELLQVKWAMHFSTVLASRMFPRILNLENKVCPVNT